MARSIGRRGRAELLKAEGMVLDEAAVLAKTARWKTRILRGAKIEDDLGKEIYADSLARALVRLQMWSELEARGGLSSEETRSMPGLLKTVMHLSAKLGIGKPLEEPDQDDEL